MGNYCNCSKALIDGENSTQCEFGEKLNLLAEIRKKFEKYNNSEYIPKEELDKLISSFPNSEELIYEFEQKTKDLIQSKEKII